MKLTGLPKTNLLILTLALLGAGGAISWAAAYYWLHPAPSSSAESVSGTAAADADAQSLLEGFSNNGLEAAAAAKDLSLMDHKAIVAVLHGTATILKKGHTRWQPLTVGMHVSGGDQVRTDSNAFVGIYYDKFYKNMAQINENSLAEFISIEPTRIRISNGEIYSSLEGLPDGSVYDVITPTSVGGVRGTQFVRAFDPQHQLDSTAVIKGSVEVKLNTSEKIRPTLVVTAGKKLDFSKDQLTEDALKTVRTENLSATMANTFEALFAQMRQRLMESAGGEGEFFSGHEAWETLKNSPDRIARIKNEIQIMVLYGDPGNAENETAADKETPAPVPSEVSTTAHLSEEPQALALEPVASESLGTKEETLAVSVDICQSQPELC